MSVATRSLVFCLLLSAMSVIGFGQLKASNPGAAAVAAGSLYYPKKSPIDVRQLTVGSGTVLTMKGTVVGSTPDKVQCTAAKHWQELSTALTAFPRSIVRLPCKTAQIFKLSSALP